MWYALRPLQFCADNIMYLYQLSRCCQCRSRCKPIHLSLNNIRDCQCGCPVALIILLMQDEKLFTLHRHSSLGCSRECIPVHFDDTGSQHIKHRHQQNKVNILQSIVENRTLTRNRKSWTREPEIGRDEANQPWENPWVEWYRYRFGTPRGSGSGFWATLELNWTVYPVQIRTIGQLTGPVAKSSIQCVLHTSCTESSQN